MIRATLIEVIREALVSDRDALHVALPAKVIRYDEAKQEVDLAISVRHLREGETWEDYPTLLAVPLVFPRNKDFAIVFPVAPGDRCMVVFADSNLGEWRASGDGAESQDPERHGLAGAFAVLGGYPSSAPWGAVPPNTIVIEHATGTRLAVDATTVTVGRAGALPVPTLASVNAALAAVLAYAASIPGAPPPPAPPVATGTTEFKAK